MIRCHSAHRYRGWKNKRTILVNMVGVKRTMTKFHNQFDIAASVWVTPRVWPGNISALTIHGVPFQLKE